MAVLPPGPYVLKVIKVEERKTTMSGWDTYLAQLQLLGTTWDDLYWWVTSSPQAKWVWEDAVENFDDIPNLVGRAFLFNVYIERPKTSNDRFRNRVKNPLAELVSMEEHMFEWELRKDWGV